MTLHLIKLCVGVDTITELAAWQKKRAAQRKKQGGRGDIMHITRHTPKRAEELLAGGSIYWVIKGQIAVRQRLVGFRQVSREGVPHCAIVLDKQLMPTERRNYRAFQGWRYFVSKDAPRNPKKHAISTRPASRRAR